MLAVYDSLARGGKPFGMEQVLTREALRTAIDTRVDSARVANDSVLSLSSLLMNPLNRLGVFARRPWLLRTAPATRTAFLPLAEARLYYDFFWGLRGEWSARMRSTLASMPPIIVPNQLAGLRWRAIAQVAGLNTGDAALSASLEALARDSSLSSSARWESEYLGVQPRLASRDTTGLGVLLERLAADTQPQARFFERTIVAQRNLALGVAGAVDSLVAVNRDLGERSSIFSLFVISGWLAADSLLARGNAARVDSMTVYLQAIGGTPTAGSAFSPIAPAMLLLRARALEALGKREDALVIAEAMQVMVRGNTPETAPLRAAYAEMAKRLESPVDASKSTVVPGKR